MPLLPRLAAVPFASGGVARLPAVRRHRGAAISVALHLALLALLLLRLDAAPASRIEAERSISVLLLGAPSPAPQAAAPAPAPRPSTPAAERARPKPKPVPQTAVSPSAVQPATPAVAAAAAVPTSSPATAGADPATLSTAAASVPDAVEPDVPPPLEYLRKLAWIISRSQKYPWSARQYGHQGDVIVRMHLRRDGRVLSASLLRSSGHAALDAEAQDVVLRIGYFPPFPADYIPQQREFDIDQPVTFRTYLN